MNLDETQKRTVAAWIEAGLKLAEIQKRLDSEFGLRVTYMEVRFLIDDLKLKLIDAEPPAPAPQAAAVLAPPVPAAPPVDSAAAATPGATKVSLVVDQVARPGALVSGSVTFTDGQSADWSLDQHGRLGFAPKTQGYRPPEEDVVSFQVELQSALAKLGF